MAIQASSTEFTSPTDVVIKASSSQSYVGTYEYLTDGNGLSSARVLVNAQHSSMESGVATRMIYQFMLVFKYNSPLYSGDLPVFSRRTIETTGTQINEQTMRIESSMNAFSQVVE